MLSYKFHVQLSIFVLEKLKSYANLTLHYTFQYGQKKEVHSKLLNILTRIFNSFGRLWNMESVVTQYLLILKRPRQHNNNNDRLTAFDPGQPVASDHLHPDLSILLPLPYLRPYIYSPHMPFPP